jgi:hypothetical protein
VAAGLPREAARGAEAQRGGAGHALDEPIAVAGPRVQFQAMFFVPPSSRFFVPLSSRRRRIAPKESPPCAAGGPSGPFAASFATGTMAVSPARAWRQSFGLCGGVEH